MMTDLTFESKIVKLEAENKILRELLKSCSEDLTKFMNSKFPSKHSDLMVEKYMEIPGMGKLILGNKWYRQDEVDSILNERKIQL